MKHDITKAPEIELIRPVYFDMKKGVMEADGTRYEALVIPVTDFSLEMLGAVDDGYLVVDGLTRRSYLLNRKGYLDPAYIGEKFPEMSVCDVENFITLLSALMPERTAP